MSQRKDEDWRVRLRAAVRRSGRKQAAIAWDAGIAPETLSRVLNDVHARPAFDTIVGIVHASGETVGWLLGERGYCLSGDQIAKARTVAKFLSTITSEDRDR